MINQITSSTVSHLNTPQRASTPTSAPNSKPAQTTSFSPESSLRIVNDNVIDGIDKELATNNATPIRNLNAEDFTPESVAKGILNFVQSAISRAEARGQSTGDLMKQARAGIESGFDQAKNILTSLNALSGQIAEGVQKTYDLIQNGLELMENGGAVNQQAELTQASKQTQSQTRSFELNIKTQDGDDVKISVSQSQSHQQFEASQAKDGENASFSQFQSNSSDRFEFTVSGNLDKAEISAIEEMLAEVKAVSENFFEGNVNAAFEAGLSLGFNTKEIANFALELNESQTQTASRAYREVSSFGSQNNRVSPSQLENLLKPAHEFMLALSNDVEKANNSELFKNATSNPVEGLFNYFARNNDKHEHQVQNIESLTGGSFENVTEQLISAVRST